MLIEKINILNFGPFYGSHEIEFQNNGLGVHIIRGNNGQGKTSLQRAILWALYGKVLDRKGQEIPPTSLLNHTAFKEDKYQFGVRIFFEHEGENWSIVREMKARSHQDKNYMKGMTINVVKEGKVRPDPENEIQRILPYDVSRFHFFDGEMLRDYEELLDKDSPSMALLRDSIERVLGVPCFKTARDDLEAVQTKFERERSRLMRRLGGKELQELADDLQSVMEGIDRTQRSIGELEKQKSELDNEILEKKRKLSDMKEVQELGKRQLEIDRDIKILEANRERKLAEIQTLVKDLYKTVLIPVANNVISQLEHKSKAALKKYNKKQRAIDRKGMIENDMKNHKCSYCGTVLNETKLRELEKELQEVLVQIDHLTEVPEPNLTFENYKDRLAMMVPQATNRDDFRGIEGEKNEIDHKLAGLTAELKQIEEKLEISDFEEASRLEIEIREGINESGRLDGIISSKKEELLDYDSIKAELDRKMASIPQSELNKLSGQIEFVKSVKEVFQDAVSIYRDERRSDVEQNATEIFTKIRSKEEFDRLSINDQFGLSIVTSRGTLLNRSEWRSAGEEQIVALSLIGALNKCAQIKAPVFMDTPFGRLDSIHHERVLGYTPYLADQVVLLVMDREFREGDEQFLEGKIKSDFTLLYKNEEEGSSIITT